MTAIVGILCKDGAVIGTDSSATFSTGRANTIEQPTQKLQVIGDRVVFSGTGSVGLDQRFSAVVKRAVAENILNNPSHVEVAKALSRMMIEDMRQTYLQPGQYGCLLAFPHGGKTRLCEFQQADFQPEFKDDRIWYASMGGTQAITDPFLALMREVFWSDGQPNIDEGVFAAVWALDHAISVNAGGVNAPIRIAVLERRSDNALMGRILGGEELAQHEQNVTAAKHHLRDFRRKHQSIAADGLPPAPKL